MSCLNRQQSVASDARLNLFILPKQCCLGRQITRLWQLCLPALLLLFGRVNYISDVWIVSWLCCKFALQEVWGAPSAKAFNKVNALWSPCVKFIKCILGNYSLNKLSFLLCGFAERPCATTWRREEIRQSSYCMQKSHRNRTAMKKGVW